MMAIISDPEDLKPLIQFAIAKGDYHEAQKLNFLSIYLRDMAA